MPCTAIKALVFCEQTLHKDLIDTSRDCPQYTLKNRGQTNFSRKLRVKIQFPRVLLVFSSLHNISSYIFTTYWYVYQYNLKNARRGGLKNYIYFYLQELQVQLQAQWLVESVNMQQITGHVLIFLKKNMTNYPGFLRFR